MRRGLFSWAGEGKRGHLPAAAGVGGCSPDFRWPESMSLATEGVNRLGLAPRRQFPNSEERNRKKSRFRPPRRERSAASCGSETFQEEAGEAAGESGGMR